MLSDPTVPLPILRWKPTRSTVLLSPMLKFDAVFVSPGSEKNFCSSVWAVMALSIVSCCRMKRTTTRAKSRTCPVTAKEVTVVVVVVDVVLVVVGEVVTEVIVWEIEVDALLVDVVAVAVVRFCRIRRSTDVSEELGKTISSASPTSVSVPSKVTRAFSLLQLRFAALKRARIELVNSGMEKFVRAASMRRSIASPMVTFSTVVSVVLTVVVEQPVSPAMVQLVPVKPSVQMQIHTPEDITF